MSDEQRKDEEAEVEAHRRKKDAMSEPSDEAEADDEVEAHRMRKTNSRLD
jgi:hypothetical protein